MTEIYLHVQTEKCAHHQLSQRWAEMVVETDYYYSHARTVVARALGCSLGPPGPSAQRDSQHLRVRVELIGHL